MVQFSGRQTKSCTTQNSPATTDHSSVMKQNPMALLIMRLYTLYTQIFIHRLGITHPWHATHHATHRVEHSKLEQSTLSIVHILLLYIKTFSFCTRTGEGGGWLAWFGSRCTCGSGTEVATAQLHTTSHTSQQAEKKVRRTTKVP